MSAGRPKKRKKARKATPAPAVAPTKIERRTDGKVHLGLARDPATGRERLDLIKPVFVEDWQNRLTAAAANTALSMLRTKWSADGAADLGRAAMDSTSTLVGGLLARAPAGTIACQSGCDHCCYQSVGVTPPEALAILAHVQATRSLEELDTLRARLREYRAKTRDLAAHERVSPDLPCPFLEGRACSIYPVRPLSCRGMNSLDRSVCEMKLHDPATREASLAGTLPGHVLIEPIRAFHAISAGLQLALAECFGLDMRPLDLAWALDLLLEARAPEGSLDGDVVTRGRAREPALSPARGGDASQDAVRVGLAGVG
jgi:Fe-S-cluster containining protein